MPPIDLVKYDDMSSAEKEAWLVKVFGTSGVGLDDMSSAEKEAWLVKVFGTSGVGLMARDVFLGVNDGDIAPPETI